MGVHLERYSSNIFKATGQGRAIAELVHGQKWLADERPFVAKNHGTVIDSIRTVMREAVINPKNHDPFLIREEDRRGPVVGLARIIGRQTISHPEREHLLRATALDYWLCEAAEPTTHADVAEALFQEGLYQQMKHTGGFMMAITIEFDPSEGGPSEVAVSSSLSLNAITIVGESQTHRPEELIERMHKEGRPATLRVPPPLEDPFGIARDHGVSQMYHFSGTAIPNDIPMPEITDL